MLLHRIGTWRLHLATSAFDAYRAGIAGDLHTYQGCTGGGNGLSLNLEGAQENTIDGASHQVLLRGEVGF